MLFSVTGGFFGALYELRRLDPYFAEVRLILTSTVSWKFEMLAGSKCVFSEESSSSIRAVRKVFEDRLAVRLDLRDDLRSPLSPNRVSSPSR